MTREEKNNFIKLLKLKHLLSDINKDIKNTEFLSYFLENIKTIIEDYYSEKEYFDKTMANKDFKEIDNIKKMWEQSYDEMFIAINRMKRLYNDLIHILKNYFKFPKQK